MREGYVSAPKTFGLPQHSEQMRQLISADIKRQINRFDPKLSKCRIP